MRTMVVVAFMIFLLAGLAGAQVPTSGNAFLGYSFYNTDLSSIDRANTNGWEGTLEGKVAPLLGVIVDFSGHYGSQNFPGPLCPNCPSTVNLNVTEQNVLFGPRLSVPVGKFRPFAEAMFGIGHVNVHASVTDTSFATALGGGLDYRLARLVAWRFQGDFVQTRFFSTHQNNARISTGIVFRF